jgi:hypothetical protein
MFYHRSWDIVQTTRYLVKKNPQEMDVDTQLMIAVLVILCLALLFIMDMWRKINGIFYTTQCPKIYSHINEVNMKSFLPI